MYQQTIVNIDRGRIIVTSPHGESDFRRVDIGPTTLDPRDINATCLQVADGRILLTDVRRVVGSTRDGNATIERYDVDVGPESLLDGPTLPTLTCRVERY